MTDAFLAERRATGPLPADWSQTHRDLVTREGLAASFFGATGDEPLGGRA